MLYECLGCVRIPQCWLPVSGRAGNRVLLKLAKLCAGTYLWSWRACKCTSHTPLRRCMGGPGSSNIVDCASR